MAEGKRDESLSAEEIDDLEWKIKQDEEALKKREEENNEIYKKRTESIENYEEAWGNVNEQTEKVEENINQIAEIELQKLELELELKLTITEV